MTWFLDSLKQDVDVLSRSLAQSRAAAGAAAAASRAADRRTNPPGASPMISPLERARLLDAEMQLQRAWLELSLRELSSAARGSPWAMLQPLKLGMMGCRFSNIDRCGSRPSACW